jgi:hypothetical protein
VSVQAMNLPIGKLFYFIPKIQDRDVNNAHYSPYGYPSPSTDSGEGYGTGVNLYDRFYESGDGNSPETGLFDYSKGRFSAITMNAASVVNFSNGVATAVSPLSSLNSQSVSSLILTFTGFAKDGQGKLIGPNGQIMDTEEFLASAEVKFSGVSKNFNVVTQKYGKGIVEYGQKSTATFPTSMGGTSKYNDICDETGTIYIQVDLQNYSSVSGYSNTTLNSTFALADFVLHFRVYESVKFLSIFNL